MKGYQVKRKAGWDTHGLPIELGVEKELGITKEDIGKTISVEEYNAACRKAVMRYTDIWNNLTQQMGYWVNMDDPYITYEPKYMESVWWLLKQIYSKKLVVQGVYHPAIFSKSRNRIKFSRVKSAWNLSRCNRYYCSSSVQSCRKYTANVFKEV